MPKGFFAIGNDELAQGAPIKKGDLIDCPHCGKRHRISLGKTGGIENNTLQFYKCGEKAYLAGVNGRNVMRKFTLKEAGHA